MLKDGSPKQKGVAIGVGNTIHQNIININSSDGILENCSLQIDGYATPRERMHLFQKIELPSTINSHLIKSNLSMAQRWIQSAQNPDDYGLPTDDKGSESCTWASAGLLWSGWVTEGKTHDWWRKCLRWVLSQSNSDNGIPIVRKNDCSITDATAFTLMSTSIAGDEFSATADKLSAWILDMQNNGGWKWSSRATSYNYISAGLALLALKTYFHVSGNKGDQIGIALHSGIKWICQNRNLDGGWGIQPHDKSRPANTGFMVYVLSALGQTNQALESLQFLQQSFKENTGWENSVDRPASHNVTRLGLPYTLLGLASLSPSDDRDKLLDHGFNLLLNGFSNGVYAIPDTVARSWPTRDFIFACSSITDN